MLVNETERPAEQVDAGRDDRRPDAGVVEHQRFDQIVGVALVIGRVDDAVLPGRVNRVGDVLADAFNLAKNRVERILERAIQLVALGRPQFFEIRDDAFAGGVAGESVTAREIRRDFFVRQNRGRQLVHQTPGILP